jgi:hypothetical protein
MNPRTLLIIHFSTEGHDRTSNILVTLMGGATAASNMRWFCVKANAFQYERRQARFMLGGSIS